jgi:hypothetical protein
MQPVFVADGNGAGGSGLDNPGVLPQPMGQGSDG